MKWVLIALNDDNTHPIANRQLINQFLDVLKDSYNKEGKTEISASKMAMKMDGCICPVDETQQDYLKKAIDQRYPIFMHMIQYVNFDANNNQFIDTNPIV